MPAPADAQQPRARPGHLGGGLRGDGACAERPPPPIEPARGARTVQVGGRRAPDPTTLREMAPRVQEDVGQSATHLTRCAQQAMVVAPVENRPGPSADAIHGPRQASPDALHAARERLLAVGLDDQVGVVALQRVVRHAEVAALARLGQRASPLVDQRPTAQRGDALAHAQRDVDRAVPRDLLAPSMPDPRPRPSRPPRARSRATSSGPHPVVAEGELLRPARHGDRIWRSFTIVKVLIALFTAASHPTADASRESKVLPVRETRDSRRREDVVGRARARHADHIGPRARCPGPAAPTRATPRELRSAEGPTPIPRSSGKRQTATRRDLPSRRSCTGSSASSSKPSWLTRDRETSQPPASSSRSFGPTFAVACWRTASCACTATIAGSTASFRSRASDAASARPVAGGAWPTPRRTSWTASSPRCRSASGSSRCPTRFATAAPTTRGSRAKCSASSSARSSPSSAGARDISGESLAATAAPSPSSSASAPPSMRTSTSTRWSSTVSTPGRSASRRASFPCPGRAVTRSPGCWRVRRAGSRDCSSHAPMATTTLSPATSPCSPRWLPHRCAHASRPVPTPASGGGASAIASSRKTPRPIPKPRAAFPSMAG